MALISKILRHVQGLGITNAYLTSTQKIQTRISVTAQAIPEQLLPIGVTFEFGLMSTARDL
jgi:hypothetical protein